ncbi:sensor domain-containing protein [Cellulomonas septica]|uniref:Sensor domain-containing protein n=1 Tax=Cellulomonas septica TaxID=285080 RepID=A0ABX1K1S2_9CELL|nr:sensor domain-containing protein [Cellulomonas septica]
MAGTQPQADGTAPDSGPPDGSTWGPPPERRSRGWWWLLVGAVVVAVVLLVVRPWASAAPAPTPSADSTTTGTSPTPSPTVSVVPPADEAVFDATTLGSLFVTDADLEADVPAARDGIERTDTGEMVWGLPEGSSVDPASCTTAVTVVAEPPPAYGGRIWANDAMTFVQQVTVLPDPATARQAFAQLVTTVDACPTYSQVNPGVDGATWTADAAIEGQGVYPSIVQPVVHTAEGDDVPAYRGHLLVGNTIVTWTASALADADAQAALDTLGEPESLDTMVQQRAQKAVLGLG